MLKFKAKRVFSSGLVLDTKNFPTIDGFFIWVEIINNLFSYLIKSFHFLFLIKRLVLLFITQKIKANSDLLLIHQQDLLQQEFIIYFFHPLVNFLNRIGKTTVLLSWFHTKSVENLTVYKFALFGVRIWKSSEQKKQINFHNYGNCCADCFVELISSFSAMIINIECKDKLRNVLQANGKQLTWLSW